MAGAIADRGRVEVRDDRGKPLVEGVQFSAFEIGEREDPVSHEKRIFARGEFARADQSTENKRMYGRELLEREVGRLQEAVSDRRLFGELDHPSDGKLSLQRASHIVTELKLTDDGRVLGEMEIMDTQQGLNLQAILAKRGKVGVSTRGFGSVTQNADGVQVVQDDYNLVTFDIVANPADAHAYPKFFGESKEGGLMDTKTMLEQLKKEHPEVVAALRAEMRENGEEPHVEPHDDEETKKKKEAEVAASVAKAVESLRAESYDQALAELRTDPRTAGAAATLSKVAALVAPLVLPEDAQRVVEAKEKEVIDLRTKLITVEQQVVEERKQRTEAEGLAKRFGYRMYLDQALSTEVAEDATLIRKLLGPVDQFQNKEELDTKLSGVRESIKEARESRKRQEVERTALVTKYEAKLEDVRRELDTIKQERDESLKVAKGFGMKALVEQVAANHPQGPRLRQLFEDGRIHSQDELVTLARELKDGTSEEFSRLGDRIRANLGRGIEHLDESASPRGGRDGGAGRGGDLFGQSMDTLRTLSGVGGDGNGKR
jgi:hypothetical protein